MNILTVSGVSKTYSGRKLLAAIDFSMQDGEKVGVIGINGTGKSTLLKIISGIVEPDDGEVILANHVIVRYLPQTPVFDEDETVLESVLKRADPHAQPWEIEGRAKAMLTKLSFSDYAQKTAELSGGQRKRLALAAVLLSGADILVLDEPTNHLDGEMCDWLESELKNHRGALIMVTHDRYFLDSVCGRILEIDKGGAYSYETNYAGFLELKAEREEMAAASERKRQTILRTELAWIRRGARARTTKQKGRIQRYEALKDQKAPETDAQAQIGSIASRLGRTTVELENLSKAYGDKKLFSDFSYIFLKNDRVGFVGSNGCGKTTLLKIIAGQQLPDSGTVTVGQTVKIGYYAQEIERADDYSEGAMDENQRVIDYIKDTAEYIRTDEGLVSASKMLERFLFTPDMQYSPLGKLSGGEKRRLNLLRVLMGAPNVLILDEPTNDLDIETMTILEDFLDRFEGIVITVSHDRYFLDRTMRRIFAFENGDLVQYEGGYTDYRQRVLEREATAQPAPKEVKSASEETGTTTAKAKPRTQKLKFSFKEKREYETIEADIASLEETIEDLDAQMSAAASDFMKLRELSDRKEQLQAELEEKMDRWMYLEDLAQKIAEQDGQ